ncbi:MAG TPA: PQQ-binding-like beta-propeller repeat protein, partial [Longimicrobiales bacterium]|nr:PQQ-binding-like beta-propeller repeat protein [Longimicrobiales bacterium]
RDGTFFAVDAETGRERWRLGTGEEVPWDWGHESADIFTSSPLLWGDQVLFGSGDGHLYAVDAATGRVRWRTFLHGRIRSSPAIRDGRVVVGSADGSVYVLELEGGAILQRLDTEGRSLFSGDFGFDRKTVQSTPALGGRRPDDEGAERLAASRGGAVRAYVGAKDGHLYAFDLTAGRTAWRSDHRVSWVLGGPSLAGNTVYAGTSDGRFVQAVDAETGREAWRFETPSSVWTSPAVAAGVLYVGDNAGFLRALDRDTGEELWSFGTGGRMQSSPVPDGGRVFVGSDDGGVYALGEGEPVRRAVFWDSSYVKASWYRGHRELRDYLSARGYSATDAEELEAFIRARIEDGAPSVVVFAMDAAPSAVVAGGRASLLRRYLEGGGKVVWVGVPPLLWTRDRETGSPGDLTHVDRDATRELLGVDHDRGNFDVYGTWPTPAGQDWGLEGWWHARWAASPDSALTPLAMNEHGLAAAWARSYGGPPGTGFVRIWGDYASIPDPRVVHTVAEYRPPGECVATK